MSNTLIGGQTTVTIPAGTATALKNGGIAVTPYGSATATADKAGDLVAGFPITGGFLSSSNVILHQGSGLTFSDKSGAVTVSDFRIDTQTDLVYGDVTETVGKTVTSLSNVDIFNIGSGLSLTLTNDAVAALNGVLKSALTTSVPIGTAAPSPVANPLPVALEENPLFKALFGGCASGPGPIVDGVTNVNLTAAAALTKAGVSVSSLGSATLNGTVASFAITGGTATSSGDVILHQGSGLEFKDKAGTVDVQNLLVDTIHNQVDAYVTLNGKFAGDIEVFTIGQGGSLALTAGAASALDATLGLGTALGQGTVVGTASPHPFALSAHEAALLGHFFG